MKRIYCLIFLILSYQTTFAGLSASLFFTPEGKSDVITGGELKNEDLTVNIRANYTGSGRLTRVELYEYNTIGLDENGNPDPDFELVQRWDNINTNNIEFQSTYSQANDETTHRYKVLSFSSGTVLESPEASINLYKEAIILSYCSQKISVNGVLDCFNYYPKIVAKQLSRDVGERWNDDDTCSMRYGISKETQYVSPTGGYQNIQVSEGYDYEYGAYPIYDFLPVYNISVTPQIGQFFKPSNFTTFDGISLGAKTSPKLSNNKTCAELGGTTVLSGGVGICKVPGATCPAEYGWGKYFNWSETTSVTHGPGGGDSCGEGWGCTTGGHSFSNTPIERCYYTRQVWKFPSCKTKYFLQTAKVDYVGCVQTDFCRADTTLPVGNLHMFDSTGKNVSGNSTSTLYWTKNSIKFYPTGHDADTSGIKSIQLFEQDGSNPYTLVKSWGKMELGTNYGKVGVTEIFGDTFSVLNPYTRNPENGKTFRYKVVVRDRAGNIGEYYSRDIGFDTTIPQIGDIVSISPTNGTKLLATNNQAFNISVSNAGGSPIVQTNAVFEKYDNISNFNYYSSISGNLDFTVNIEDVDDQRGIDGSRPYSLYVGYICDEAGNCNNTWMQNLTYSVFANSLLMSLNQTNTLGLTSNIANGNSSTVNVELQDTYGNAIVPASAIDRTIDFLIGYKNNLYLDQYMRQGLSSVYIQSPSESNFQNLSISGLDVNTYLRTNQTSSNGIYPFTLRFYTPTANSSPSVDPEAIFSIEDIDVRIHGDLGQRLSGLSATTGAIQAYFRPLFSTDISGELQDSDFYEGRIQKSFVEVFKNGLSVPAGFQSGEIKVEFGTGSRLSASGLRMQYDITTPPTKIMSNGNTGNIANVSSLTSLSSDSIQNYDLYTKLVRLGGSAVSKIQLYLSSHITYLISNPNTSLVGNVRISYNGDVVNKSNYFDNTVNGSGAIQQGVKVTGISSSKNTTQVNVNQNQDLQVFGKLDKSTLKKDIISAIYKTIKNISLVKPNGVSTNGSKQITNLGDFLSNSDGAKGLKNSLLYFGNLSGSYVEVTSSSNPKRVQGKKTILIVGGDLLISENMYYGNSADILGIAVLKDEKGKGGNVYIDPNVTNIVGTILADGSILSGRKYPSDSTKIQIIDDNVSNSFDILKNQLHIYGSIISENTLGGSRLSTPTCPFFVKKTDCSLEVSERYDLNFLRRYNLVTRGTYDGLPYGNFSGPPYKSDAKVSGAGTCEILNTGEVRCSNPYGGQLKRTLTDITNAKDPALSNNDQRSYGKYSVIIEYNPSISKIQPPLFGK